MWREERERKQRTEEVGGFFGRVDSLDNKVTDFQQKLPENSPTVGCLQKWQDKLKYFNLKTEATDLLDEVKELLAQHDDLKSSDRLLTDIVEQHAEEQRPTRHVKGVYWSYNSRMLVSDVDSTLFTHIFYYSADVIDDISGKVSLSSQQTVSTFTSTLLQKNPSVKIILTIGAYNLGSNNPAMVSIAGNASSRKALIESSIHIARLCEFSGFNLNWKYPNGLEQNANFCTLLDEWRVAIVTEAAATGMMKLLLTASVNYTPLDYPINSFKKSLDWINVYSYNFYGPNRDPFSTHPQAPLDNISFGIDSWIRKGLPRDKIVLGISFYGIPWNLVNPTKEFGIGAKANGYASIFDQRGLSSKDINKFIKDNKIKTMYDSATVTNYCYAGTTWIGYDGVEAIDGKILYAKRERLLGYLAWDIEYDDDNFILSNSGMCVCKLNLTFLKKLSLFMINLIRFLLYIFLYRLIQLI